MKSQTSMLGIVFIVVLILFGLLFVIGQSLTKKTDSFKMAESEQMAGALYVLMKTTVACDQIFCEGNKMRMDELVKNCVRDNSCAAIEGKIREYLDFAMKGKGINYAFTADYDNNAYLELKEGTCWEKTSAYAFIPLNDKKINVALEVCYA
jgi:hypothetical protein